MGYCPWGHEELDMTERIKWNLGKWYRYLQGRNRDTDVENGHVDMGRGRVGCLFL